MILEVVEEKMEGEVDMIWNDYQVLLVHRMRSVAIFCCHNRMFLVCNVLSEYTRFQGVSVF